MSGGDPGRGFDPSDDLQASGAGKKGGSGSNNAAGLSGLYGADDDLSADGKKKKKKKGTGLDGDDLNMPDSMLSEEARARRRQQLLAMNDAVRSTDFSGFFYYLNFFIYSLCFFSSSSCSGFHSVCP
jgi:hypothetical protein